MKISSRCYLISGVALFLILIGVSIRLVFPPFGNLLKELPEGNFTAVELFQEFTGDPTGAWLRLANKVIILEGEVSAAGAGYIVMGKDMCVVRSIFRKSIYDRKPVLKTGDRVTVKGICRGMNMTEVLVTHCIILNKPEN
ncbi:MAG: hypothetical protein NTV01_22620 [Bacteroidia bacterium]|nr:hypothetical protein [Bacteroidia bacterium]